MERYISPQRAAGRPGKTPAKSKFYDSRNVADADRVGNCLQEVGRKSRSDTIARLILFTCPKCEDDVRREPAAENGAVQIWCGCDEHSFPIGNLLPENPEEWEFVVKRVGRGIRDAQAEYEARVKRLMVSDHVSRYRDKFAKEDAKI
jgi:hypothetical protein